MVDTDGTRVMEDGFANLIVWYELQCKAVFLSYGTFGNNVLNDAEWNAMTREFTTEKKIGPFRAVMQGSSSMDCIEDVRDCYGCRYGGERCCCRRELVQLL